MTLSKSKALLGPMNVILKISFFAYSNDQGYVYISDTLAKKIFKSLHNHGIEILINKKHRIQRFIKSFMII